MKISIDALKVSGLEDRVNLVLSDEDVSKQAFKMTIGGEDYLVDAREMVRAIACLRMEALEDNDLGRTDENDKSELKDDYFSAANTHIDLELIKLFEDAINEV